LKSGAKKFTELLVDSQDEAVQFQPRNANQVTYFKSSNANGGKVWKDEFLALHELAYTIPGFTWFISTYPDTVVACGCAFFIDLLRSGAVILLSYDTTFNLGNFYVSVLMAQVGAFSERPSFPIAFLVHDRKFEETHKTFFEQLKKVIRTTEQFVIVTDGESAVINAIKSSFPTWNLVACWNHIMNDIEVWHKKRHIEAKEIVVYKSTVRELLMCQTAEEQKVKFDTVGPTWSEAFQDYYNRSLSKRVNIASRYYLGKVGLQQESVTNNISESFNSILKRHQDWQEVTVDRMVFVLNQLQMAYKTKIIRSTKGFGPYTLQADVAIGRYISFRIINITFK
jgi:MULE transposase domain